MREGRRADRAAPGGPLACRALGVSRAARSSLGEGPEDALIRELAEELGIAIAPADLAPLTFASHVYPDFHLLMPLYLCRHWRGDPGRP